MSPRTYVAVLDEHFYGQMVVFDLFFHVHLWLTCVVVFTYFFTLLLIFIIAFRIRNKQFLEAFSSRQWSNFFSRFKSFDTVVFGDNEVSIGNLICFPNTNPYGEYCENCVAGDIRNVILLTASSFGQLGWILAYILW